MQELRIIGLHSAHEVVAADDLIAWVAGLCARDQFALEPGDLLVFAQKVISKSEGRRVVLRDVTPSAEAEKLAEVSGKDARITELMLRESTAIVRATPYVVVMRHKTGVVLANAGIDRSNVLQDPDGETVLLWPEDPDASAARLHRQASELHGFPVPVIINDSLGRAWRKGTVGTAIGAAGLACLLDLRGKPDRHGFRLVSSEVGVADELAAAASLVMGQASESIAVVVIRGAVHDRAASGQITGQGRAADLVRPLQEDLFT